MTADYAALEERVAQLEQQMRHVLPAKIDALAYGVSLVHEDVRAIRVEQQRQGEALAQHGEALAGHGAMLERQGEALASQAQTLAQHGQLLAEILRRLPPAQPGA